MTLPPGWPAMSIDQATKLLTAPGTRFELEQIPVSETLWLPKRFVVTVRATALGIHNEDSFNEDDFRDYQLQAENGPPVKESRELRGR